MAFTQLSPAAIPGIRYSFSAKTASTSSPRGSDLFTDLSVLAIPGPRHAFVAKTASTSFPRGDDLFTVLSPLALPGRRYTFSAKTAAVVAPAEAIIKKWAGGRPPGRRRILQRTFFTDTDEGREFALKALIMWEDKELLEMIANLITSGILT